MNIFVFNDIFHNLFSSKKYIREFKCIPILRHVWILFFFGIRQLAETVQSVEVSQSIMSDHKIVFLYLFTERNERRNWYWKINNSTVLHLLLTILE